MDLLSWQRRRYDWSKQCICISIYLNIPCDYDSDAAMVNTVRKSDDLDAVVWLECWHHLRYWSQFPYALNEPAAMRCECSRHMAHSQTMIPHRCKLQPRGFAGATRNTCAHIDHFTPNSCYCCTQELETKKRLVTLPPVAIGN